VLAKYSRGIKSIINPSFLDYLFGVATEASKKVTSTVNETAQTLKKTVEEKVTIRQCRTNSSRIL